MLDQITPNNQINSSQKKKQIKLALVYPNGENIKPILLLRIETLFIEMFQWFNDLQSFQGMNTAHETDH